jgi:pyruvate/2-oxoglutarate dehydrogenase complex dihydrolipoamide acyltransferase (E2) component
MNISEEYEARAQSVLIDVVQAHPELSIAQIVEKLGLNEDDAGRLQNTPLRDLMAMDVPEAAAAPTHGTNGTSRRPLLSAGNGVRRTPRREAAPAAKKKTAKKAAKKTAKNGAKKAPPRAKAVAGAADVAVAKFVASIRKGTQFSTGSIMDTTGLGRKTVLRAIEKLDNVSKHGRGRSAYLKKK